MKEYQLRIWYGGTYQDLVVFAQYFTTNDGIYFFFADGQLVCSYPTSKTAIISICNADE